MPPRRSAPGYVRVWASVFSRASPLRSSSCRVLTRASAPSASLSTWSSVLLRSAISFSSCCCCSCRVALLASNFFSSFSLSFWSLWNVLLENNLSQSWTNKQCPKGIFTDTSQTPVQTESSKQLTVIESEFCLQKGSRRDWKMIWPACEEGIHRNWHVATKVLYGACSTVLMVHNINSKGAKELV